MNTDTHAAFPSGAVTYTNWGRSAIEAALRMEDLEGSTVMLPGFICQGSFEYLFERLDIDPVFVDIDSETFAIDADLATEKAAAADAAVVVHPFGYPADMSAWQDLCDDYGMSLIEDCVRALGTTYDGQVVGSFGDHAIYSLHKVGPVSIGGAIVTEHGDPTQYLEQSAYDFRAMYHLLPDHIQSVISTTYPREYESRLLDEVTERQFKSYLETEFSTAVRENAELAAQLRERLEPLGFRFQPERDSRSNFLIPTMTPSGINRDELLSYLYTNQKPCPVKIVWATPWVKSYTPDRYADEYPNTRALAENILCFTVRSMDEETLDKILTLTEEFVSAYG